MKPLILVTNDDAVLSPGIVAILDEGLPGDISLLNVNVPGDATPQTEVRVTTQSRQDYLVLERPRSRDFTVPLRLETAVRIDEATPEADSDVRAFALDRVVSVTPMTWSLTARDHWVPSRHPS